MNSTPLPGSHVTFNIAGVSYHQDVSAALSVGDPVVAVWDHGNKADSQAVQVSTPEGRVVGFVPAKTGLNARLCASGKGPWAGKVVELIDGRSENVPRAVVVTLALRGEVGAPKMAGGRFEETEQEVEKVFAPQVAFTPTGRRLGEVAGAEDGMVFVNSDDGSLLVYPHHLLVLTDP